MPPKYQIQALSDTEVETDDTKVLSYLHTTSRLPIFLLRVSSCLIGLARQGFPWNNKSKLHLGNQGLRPWSELKNGRITLQGPQHAAVTVDTTLFTDNKGSTSVNHLKEFDPFLGSTRQSRSSHWNGGFFELNLVMQVDGTDPTGPRDPPPSGGAELGCLDADRASSDTQVGRGLHVSCLSELLCRRSCVLACIPVVHMLCMTCHPVRSLAVVPHLGSAKGACFVVRRTR